MSKTISKRVEEYLQRHGCLARCLRGELINKTALAKKIQDETGVGGFTSVHNSLRKFEGKSGAEPDDYKKTIGVISKSRIHSRTDVGVVIGENKTDKLMKLVAGMKQQGKTCRMLLNNGFWVIIAPEELDKSLVSLGFKSHRNVAEISLVSPPEIEETSGVIREIILSLADRGINVIEFMSCWTSTIIVVEQDDLVDALTYLQTYGKANK